MARALAEVETVPGELEKTLRQIDKCREYESSFDPDDPRVSEDRYGTGDNHDR